MVGEIVLLGVVVVGSGDDALNSFPPFVETKRDNDGDELEVPVPVPLVVGEVLVETLVEVVVVVAASSAAAAGAAGSTPPPRPATIPSIGFDDVEDDDENIRSITSSFPNARDMAANPSPIRVQERKVRSFA